MKNHILEVQVLAVVCFLFACLLQAGLERKALWGWSEKHTLTYAWGAQWEGLDENHSDPLKPNILLNILLVFSLPLSVLLSRRATQAKRFSTRRLINALKMEGRRGRRETFSTCNPED